MPGILTNAPPLEADTSGLRPIFPRAGNSIISMCGSRFVLSIERDALFEVSLSVWELDLDLTLNTVLALIVALPAAC